MIRVGDSGRNGLHLFDKEWGGGGTLKIAVLQIVPGDRPIVSEKRTQGREFHRAIGRRDGSASRARFARKTSIQIEEGLLEGRVRGAHEREQGVGEFRIFYRSAWGQAEAPDDRSREFALDGGFEPLQGCYQFV